MEKTAQLELEKQIIEKLASTFIENFSSQSEKLTDDEKVKLYISATIGFFVCNMMVLFKKLGIENYQEDIVEQMLKGIEAGFKMQFSMKQKH